MSLKTSSDKHDSFKYTHSEFQMYTAGRRSLAVSCRTYASNTEQRIGIQFRKCCAARCMQCLVDEKTQFVFNSDIYAQPVQLIPHNLLQTTLSTAKTS